jgi:hypothetical protein
MAGAATQAGALLVLAGLLTACGGGLPPPRVMQPEDFKRLAGEWYGTAYVEQEVPVAVRGVIYENGAFYTVPRVSQEGADAGADAYRGRQGPVRLGHVGRGDDLPRDWQPMDLEVAGHDQEGQPCRDDRAHATEVISR